MKRIVIDLTEFNTWSGHLTGIQRVVYGLASGLRGRTHSVSLVRYDEHLRSFFELEPSYLDSLIGTSQINIQNQTSNNSHSLKQNLLKIYASLPTFIKIRITQKRKIALQKQGRYILHNLRQVKRKIASIQLPNKTNLRLQGKSFTFQQTDTILISGRVWDSSEYAQSLYEVARKSGAKLAFVVYDLIPIYQQHTFGEGLTERFVNYLYDILKHADYILPISKSTENDIRRFANDIGILQLPTVRKIRLGDDIFAGNASKPSFVDDNHFALSVGTIEARKNHTLIYYAYKLAKEKNIELPKMFIIGKPGWLTNDIIHFLKTDEDVKGKIEIINNVTDDQLAWLYKNALFTVYPSQYEGWGLPVSESLAFGTPCITSAVSSMTEISVLADFISPFDSKELFEKMAYYSIPENSRAKRLKIDKKYKVQAWEKTFRDIENTINL